MSTDPKRVARAAGLHYATDEREGITRVRRGRGFSYRDAAGRTIADPAERERIEALAIPPAYTEVWISPDPDSHLQATGRDERGRKQYIYHPQWREVREQEKFDRMIRFGQVLPEIRRAVKRDLRRPGLPRERVLAAVTRLLETTLIRIGNDEYARENDSYGLTTIRKKHVDVEDDNTVAFDFTGKGGQDWHVALKDARIAEVVRQCADTPGYELFKYFDEDGVRRDVGSGDVNDYLRETSGADVTAKDFRTWAGTVMAALALRESGREAAKTRAQRNVVAAMKRVAEQLGNTPAVCRRSYVHPLVIDTYLTGDLGSALDDLMRAPEALELRELQPEEAAVWLLLQQGG